jgi:hypothetical protein
MKYLGIIIVLLLFFGYGFMACYNYYIGNKAFIFWLLPTALWYGILIVELLKLKSK